MTPQRLHAKTLKMKKKSIEAYMQGALHDGTYCKRHKTHRFSQSNIEWLEHLQNLFSEIGCRSWIYREGRQRRLWILETTAKFLTIGFDSSALKTREEKISYIRGYFDAEGGIPRKIDARFYIQFTQNDKEDLARLKNLLKEIGIECGKIHNPSERIDPDYYRFFVLADSHQDFSKIVNSWHPRKKRLLDLRVMI